MAVFSFLGGVRRPSLRERHVWSGITEALGNETSSTRVFEAAFELSFICNMFKTFVFRGSEIQLRLSLAKALLSKWLKPYIELNENCVDPKR